MQTSKTKFDNAKYYDKFNALYLSELPADYFEEDGVICIKGTGDNFDHESNEIIILK